MLDRGEARGLRFGGGSLKFVGWPALASSCFPQNQKANPHGLAFFNLGCAVAISLLHHHDVGGREGRRAGDACAVFVIATQVYVAAIADFDAGAGSRVSDADDRDVTVGKGIGAGAGIGDGSGCVGQDGHRRRAANVVAIVVKGISLCRDDAARHVGHSNAVDDLCGCEVGDEAEAEEHAENKKRLFHTFKNLNLNLKTDGKLGRLHGVKRNIKEAFCRSLLDWASRVKWGKTCVKERFLGS